MRMPQPDAVRRVAVVGSGYMGGGIAQVFAAHGMECVLVDASAEQAQSAVERLVDEAVEFESADLMPQGSAKQIRRNLRAAPSLAEGVTDVDFVVEAVPEDLALKTRILTEVTAACPPAAIIGTNTSAIPIDTLAAVVSEPARFVGVHWMNPAPFVPAVEVIPGEATGDDTVALVQQLLLRVGKVPCPAPRSAGFIANRLQFALFAEACRIVEEGAATTAEIDAVVSNSFGFRLPFFGPFRIADISGLDVYAGAYESLEAAYGERFRTPAVLTELVEAGKIGVKSGEGFDHYEPDSAAELAAMRDRAYSALTALRPTVGWRQP